MGLEKAASCSYADRFSPARDVTMKHYKQLTYEQRCQIEALKKSGHSQRHIGRVVGVDQGTISRELRRNTGQRGYRHKQAQRSAHIPLHREHLF